jgi:hypothetical protein
MAVKARAIACVMKYENGVAEAVRLIMARFGAERDACLATDAA